MVMVVIFVIINHFTRFAQACATKNKSATTAAHRLFNDFVLHTDASQEGLGAVLYQKQDGKMRVIGYGSRSLTKAEKNYYLHSGKLKFLALKWAVCKHFRDYLYHVPDFVLYTD